MSVDSFHCDECANVPASAWLHRVATWCGERRVMLLIAAGLFQVAVLAAMVVIHATPLIVGETILLKVEPVDPRDLFRGDYVTLAYGINRLPPAGIEGIAGSKPSTQYTYYNRREPEERAVYVTLERDADGKHWYGTHVGVDRPEAGKFIRGVYRSQPFGPGRLSFGIETFYVPEGTGRTYEDAARSGRLTAEVRVAPWGAAKLHKLQIE